VEGEGAIQEVVLVLWSTQYGLPSGVLKRSTPARGRTRGWGSGSSEEAAGRKHACRVQGARRQRTAGGRLTGRQGRQKLVGRHGRVWNPSPRHSSPPHAVRRRVGLTPSPLRAVGRHVGSPTPRDAVGRRVGLTPTPRHDSPLRASPRRFRARRQRRFGRISPRLQRIVGRHGHVGTPSPRHSSPRHALGRRVAAVSRLSPIPPSTISALHRQTGRTPLHSRMGLFVPGR
jgi:hypothetical protein